MAKPVKQDNLPRLKQALRTGQPDRLYIFYGEESYLRQYYLDSLRKKFIDGPTAVFNFHSFNSETFDMQQFLDSLVSLPMMAEWTMILVDDVDLFKLGEDARSHMAQALSDIPEFCTVVFTYQTVEWKPDKRQKKLWGAIEQYGTVVEFPRQGLSDLISWVSKHFAKAGKRISNDLCQYLIELTDGTMSSLYNEIQKIVGFSGQEEITRYDIDAVVEPVLDAVVFQMTDLMAARNFEGALNKLQVLLQMQQEPIAILGAIGSYIRRLGAARVLLDSGKGSRELSRLCGIQDYAAQKLMGQARRFQPSFCAAAADLVVEADRKMKTSYDEPERLLELLVLGLSREAAA